VDATVGQPWAAAFDHIGRRSPVSWISTAPILLRDQPLGSLEYPRTCALAPSVSRTRTSFSVQPDSRHDINRLLWRREWARVATLVLATVPVCACALFILNHPHDVDGALFAVGDVSRPIGEVLLAILIPVNIWWWVLLTGDAVRSQFR
jgi:hypothetical protein